MKYLVPFILLCTASVVGAFDPTRAVQKLDEPDLSGIWQLSGENGNEEYHGVLMIDKKDDGSYRTAMLMFGGPTTRGVGMVKNGMLSVGWFQPAGDGVAVGLTIYEIKDKGKSLEGEWRTVAPGKAPRTEKARWLAPLKMLEV